jgi:hypothetical protein
MSDSQVRDRQSGRGGRLPRGIESIVALAAAKPAFRDRFAQDREAALREEGIELTDTERTLLESISDEEIFRMADRLDAKTRISTRGLVTAAAAVAVLGGLALLAIPNTMGIRPERVEEIRAKHAAEESAAKQKQDTGDGEPTPTPTETPAPENEGGR